MVFMMVLPFWLVPGFGSGVFEAATATRIERSRNHDRRESEEIPVDLAAPPNEVSEARRGGARMLEQEYRSGGCGEAASWQGDVKDSPVTEPADPTQGTTP